MKRVGYLIEEIADLDNLYLAFNKACRGKRCKKEVLDFQENFDKNIKEIREELLSGNVRVGDYSYFKIFDPKERLICAAPFRDRVIQHALMNVCHQYFDKKLIYTTYATRRGKGIYKALERAMKATSRFEYVVKLDYRKYYDSVSHEKLKMMLRKMFKDPTLLMVFDKIIDSYEVTEGKGLPIGNLTSQYFANTYLSAVDYRAKHIYRVDYIRYMDDILIAGDDKILLKRYVSDLIDFSRNELELNLKPPIVNKSSVGQVFCGYRVLPNRLLLSGRSKKRFRTKLLSFNKDLEKGTINEKQYQDHIIPLLAFVSHADSMNFRKACVNL